MTNVILSFFMVFAIQNSFSADSAAGKKIYKKVNCAQCHGKDGMGTAKMKKGKLDIKATKGPRVAGLSEAYLVEQLTAIQGKDKATLRKTKYTVSMKTKIKKLTEEDIKNLAAYVANELNPKAGKTKGMLEK